MGLDMYLYRKQHFKGNVKVVDGDKKTREFEDPSVEVDVAYFRKANQIHKWFVDNLADGVDECQPVDVSISDIKCLLGLCKVVRKKARLGRGLVEFGKGGIGDTEVWAVEPRKEGDKIVGFDDIKRVSAKDIKDGRWYRNGDNSYGYRNNGLDTFYEFGNTIENAEEIAKILPTQAGFFFGGTDYDEWYLSDIDSAIEQFTNIIEEHERLVADGAREYDIDYTYQASW